MAAARTVLHLLVLGLLFGLTPLSVIAPRAQEPPRQVPIPEVLSSEELRAQRQLGLVYVPVVVIGLALLAFGMYAANLKGAPLDIVGAVLAPLGLALALLGTLLVCVPDFFASP